MANAFLRIVDGGGDFKAGDVLSALGSLNSVQHQFKWLIGEIRRRSVGDAHDMLASYAGIRTLTSERKVEIAKACDLIRAMDSKDIDSIPDPAPIPPRLPGIARPKHIVLPNTTRVGRAGRGPNGGP